MMTDAPEPSKLNFQAGNGDVCCDALSPSEAGVFDRKRIAYLLITALYALES